MRDVARPAGTSPYGLAVTPGGLRSSGLGDVVGVVDATGAHLTALPPGAGPELVPPSPRPHAVLPDGAGGTFVTCWGRDSLVHVDPDGACEELAFPPGSEPHGLCHDGDGLVRVAPEAGRVAVVDPDGGLRTGRG
ncbi:NHL repeat-containing protein [Kineococcus sp. SYSU DK002]|uniref:hypothetical protein n=1 Tax=Kineococcus sp. SYSU DK002 TaxID=3383123 RepID=UPI003D7DF5F6